MNKKKILITYASYGSGHKTVANYVNNYFLSKDEYEIKVIDITEYCNIIGKISMEIFNLNVKNSKSSIFTMIYKIFNHDVTTIFYKQITKVILKNNKLKKEIVGFNPDLLISSHFFGSIIMGILNNKKLTNCKIITIITDYKSHKFWIKNEKNEDAIVVSNDIVKNQLINDGIDKDKIYPFGIPLSSKFKNVGDVNLSKKKYNITNDNKVFLFFGGGSYGSFKSYKFFKRLVKCRFDINIIFIAGKNIKLKEKCDFFIKEGNYHNILVLGFSNDINNLLNISDVVITKPGGLSVTEALELKKPLLLIPGSGGQEIDNAKFVTKNGFGLNSRTTFGLIRNVIKILTSNTILENMNKKLTLYEENTSVYKLYNLANKILTKD